MIGYIRTRDRYIHQYLTSKLNNIAIKGKIYFFSLEFLHGSEKFLLLQKHCFLEGNFFILLIHPLDNAVILQLEGNRSPVRCKIYSVFCNQNIARYFPTDMQCYASNRTECK